MSAYTASILRLQLSRSNTDWQHSMKRLAELKKSVAAEEDVLAMLGDTICDLQGAVAREEAL